jgi:hypothetical protein
MANVGKNRQLAHIQTRGICGFVEHDTSEHEHGIELPGQLFDIYGHFPTFFTSIA